MPRNPLVLVEQSVRGARIAATNEAARMAGACVGKMLSDARAACPFINVEKTTPEADATMLKRLALWASRYSPIVALDESAAPDEIVPDFGLLIDITGCDHLFGGEQAMMADIKNRLLKTGFTAQLATAPTIGAAHALARYGNGLQIAASHEEASEQVGLLPVEALRLTHDRTTLLRRLGLKTVHSVVGVPRQALERRFRARADAQSVQMRIDQLNGSISEPLLPLRSPAPWRSHMSCAEPVFDIEAIRFALTELLNRLSGRMETAAQGAQGWRLTAFHTDGGASSVTIRLSRPSREHSHILHLFEQKLEQIDPGYGIDDFLLEASDCDDVSVQQTSLVRDDEAANERLAAEMSGLVDRLSNRFGAQNITYAVPQKSHVPERAWRMVHASSGNVAKAQWEEIAFETEFRTAARPFRLFDLPERAEVSAQVPDGPPLNFRWRHMLYHITRATGPERIAPEWWREGPRGIAIRDYYQVEDTEGRRYWLFRQGSYGDDTMPEWFVHGVFGL